MRRSANNMKHWFTTNWLNLLAILILLGSFGDHPYSYYQTLRWVVCIAAAFAAHTLYQRARQGWMWIFIAVAVLFNPIAPFYLDRGTWQVWDAATGVIFFVVMIVLGRQKKRELKAGNSN